jgi:hypothetical protein
MKRGLIARVPLYALVPNVKSFRCLLAAGLVSLIVMTMAACQGVSSAHPNTSGNGGGSGQLTVSPGSLNFGNAAVGSTQNQTGTLSASGASVTVSSAAWNGQGYSVSGISFPFSLAAGKSVNYIVSFTPEATGSAPGTISFVSDAPNSPSTQAWAGTGTLAGAHSVGLSWGASSSPVTGYNIYRGTLSSGPYARLNSSLLPATSYTDASVQSGATYYYVTTAVDSSNVESAYSNQATAVIP